MLTTAYTRHRLTWQHYLTITALVAVLWFAL